MPGLTSKISYAAGLATGITLFHSVVSGLSYKLITDAPAEVCEKEANDRNQILRAYKDLGYNTSRIKFLPLENRNEYLLPGQYTAFLGTSVIITKPFSCGYHLLNDCPHINAAKFWYAVGGHEAVHTIEKHDDIQNVIGGIFFAGALIATKRFTPSLGKQLLTAAISTKIVGAQLGKYLEYRADTVSATQLGTATTLAELFSTSADMYAKETPIGKIRHTLFGTHPTWQQRKEYMEKLSATSPQNELSEQPSNNAHECSNPNHKEHPPQLEGADRLMQMVFRT